MQTLPFQLGPDNASPAPPPDRSDVHPIPTASARHELVSLRAAGKLCGRKRDVIRQLVEDGRLAAQKVGESRRGGRSCPWLKVYADDAVAAVERASRYVPLVHYTPTARRRRPPSPSAAVPADLDPMLARLLADVTVAVASPRRRTA